MPMKSLPVVLEPHLRLRGEGLHGLELLGRAYFDDGFVLALLASLNLANFTKFLQIFGGLVFGSIKKKFARKYAFYSIFQALQDLHLFAPLQSQNFRKKSV